MAPAYPGKNFPGQGKSAGWEKLSRNAANRGFVAGLVRTPAPLLPLMVGQGMLREIAIEESLT